MSSRSRPDGGDSAAVGPIRVGLAGLGRSGWDIHAALLARLEREYQIVAALDDDAAKRKEAEVRFACKTYTHYRDLLTDPAVELIVVAMPNHLHAEYSIAALRAGKHVVCEKPMATSPKDAARMVDTAEASTGFLTVFQNRRYDPDYRKIQEVVASGVLGRIVAVRMSALKFSRRWDWQTQTRLGGGELNNIGSHLVDLALQMFGGNHPEVFCHRERTLTLGDAEDHVKLVLKGEGAPTIDIEISSTCAYPTDNWHIMGTRGGLTGTHEKLQWKWLDPPDLPPRVLEISPTSDRSYNQDEPSWRVENWSTGSTFPAHHIGFYADLYRTIREAAPLTITPQSVKRVVELLDECRQISTMKSTQRQG